MSIQPVNLFNFGDGYLKFRIKIPSNVSFQIGIIDAWGNQSYVEFPSGQTKYGLVRDGEWGQASIPIDVPVTGNGFELSNGTVITKAGAKPTITGNRSNIAIGNVTIIGKANLSVTGNRVNITIGDAVAKANATAIVTGKRFNVSTSDVTVLAKAKVLPTGEGFEVGTSETLIRKWDAVPTNASQTWTAIP